MIISLLKQDQSICSLAIVEREEIKICCFGLAIAAVGEEAEIHVQEAAGRRQ